MHYSDSMLCMSSKNSKIFFLVLEDSFLRTAKILDLENSKILDLELPVLKLLSFTAVVN